MGLSIIFLNNKLIVVCPLLFIALLWFEFFPTLFEYLFGDLLKSSIRIITAIMSFSVLAYGADKCKKYLDAANDIKR